MNKVADDVWHLPLAPRASMNAYLIGDVLVDAGLPSNGKRLVKTLADRGLAAHTLTHAHGDHVGGSRAVVDGLGVPFFAPAGDAAAIEAGQQVPADNALRPVFGAMGKFKSVPIARRLSEGDEIAGFRVLDVPGHSPGHIAFWRESDRVLICGDVWFNMLLPRLTPGLREPFSFVTPDPAQNRASMRRLAALEPEIACFGHGPVLTGAAPKLRAFTDRVAGG
jgi:glyoxylase-like metal-dependent hydrolase (beta-lactamase superfamily II)